MTNEKMALPTVSGLRPYQAKIFSCKYLENHSWQEIREFAFKENLFETSRQATSDRYYHNMVKILSKLELSQLQVVADDNEKDRLAMLWLGFCKSFPFAYGFSEIVANKFRDKDFELRTGDLWKYIADKSVEYENLCDISNSLRSKVKSVIFYNLRDAGYLNTLNEILPANLSDKAKHAIGNEFLHLFPGETK